MAQTKKSTAETARKKPAGKRSTASSKAAVKKEGAKTQAKKSIATNTDMKMWKFIYDANSASEEKLDKTAIIDNGREITYRQFFRRWDNYAEVFTGLGMTEKNHSRLGLVMYSSAQALTSVYAANMVGVSVSVITETDAFDADGLIEQFRKEEITDLIFDNIFMRPESLRKIMRHKEELGLRNIILVHKNYKVTEFCSPLMRQIFEMNYRQLKNVPGVLDMHSLRVKYESTPFKKSVKQDNAAYIVHTSGTTKGVHKPIPLSDKAVNESAVRILDDPAFKDLKGGRLFCSGFMSGAFFFLDQMNLSLASGSTLVMIPLGYMNPDMPKVYKEYRITIIVAAPMLFDTLKGNPQIQKDIDFSSVKYIVLGGAFASGEKRKDINRYIAEKGGHAKVAVGYGLSETGGAVILSAPGVENDSIGYPMLGVKVKIQDETDNKLYNLTDGERSGGLYICSTSNSFGKIGRTQFFETETIDGEEYICTYDRVTVNKDGSLTCHGRMNRYFVNNEGIRFDAGLVEVSVEKEEEIEECAIVPAYDKDLHDTVPVLYIKTKTSGKESRHAVQKALYNVFIKEDTAEKTNLPGKCVVCKDLPHNQAGKTDIYQIINNGWEGDEYAIVAVRQNGKLRDVRVVPEKSAKKNPGRLPEELEDEYRRRNLPIMNILEQFNQNGKGEDRKMPEFKKMFGMMGCNPRRRDVDEDAQRPYDALRKPLMGCNPKKAAAEEDDDEDDAPSPRYNPTKLPFARPMMGCNPNKADDEEDSED